MKIKKMRKAAIDLTTTNITLGVGATLAPSAGFDKMAAQSATIGSIIGGGTAIRMMKKIGKK